MEPTTQTLTRQERLSRRGAIRRLFDQGKSGFVYPLRYMWFEEPCEDDGGELSVEVMFSVPKRFQRRANKRNLLRRRIKESYRLKKGLLAVEATQGCPSRKIEMAIVYSTKERHSYKTVDNAVEKILRHIAGSIQ